MMTKYKWICIETTNRNALTVESNLRFHASLWVAHAQNVSWTALPSVGEQEKHRAALGATCGLYLVIVVDAIVHNVIEVH